MGGGQGGDASPTGGSLIGLDPPEHGRHRAIVSRGFTPSRIAALEPRIRKIADELVDGFELRGECDLTAEFANPLPVSVIAELLGLDPARRDDFKRWSTMLIIGSTQGENAGVPRMDMFREFRDYMKRLNAQPPGSVSPETDLAVFEESFGDIDLLEKRWLQFERRTD